MKKVTFLILLTIIALIVTIYKVAPSFVDLKPYIPEIEKGFKEETGVNLDIEDIKLRTTWNFRLEAKVFKVKLKSTEEIASIDEAMFEIAIFPLLFKKVNIEKIGIVSPKITVIKYIDGSTNIDSLIKQKPTEEPKVAEQAQGTDFEIELGGIDIENYIVDLIDKGSGQKLTLKGDKLAYLNNKLNAKGDIFINGKKKLDYKAIIGFKKNYEIKNADINLKTTESIDLNEIKNYIAGFLPPEVLKTINQVDLGGFFNADLNAIYEKGKLSTNGYLNVEKTFIKYNSTAIENINIKFDLSGDKARLLNSSFNFDGQRFVLEGFIDKDLNSVIEIKPNKINIATLKRIVDTTEELAELKKQLFFIDRASGYVQLGFKLSGNLTEPDILLSITPLNPTISIKDTPIFISADSGLIEVNNEDVLLKNLKGRMLASPITLSGKVEDYMDADAIEIDLAIAGSLTAKDIEKILLFDSATGNTPIQATLKGHPKNLMLKASAKMTAENSLIGKIYPPKNFHIAELLMAIKDYGTLDFEGSALSENGNKIITLDGDIIVSEPMKFNEFKIATANDIKIEIPDTKGGTVMADGSVKLSGDLFSPDIDGEINLIELNIPEYKLSSSYITIKLNQNKKGKISAGRILADQILLKDTNVDFEFFDNGDLKLKDIKTNIAQGTVLANADVNVMNGNFKTSANLGGIQLRELVKPNEKMPYSFVGMLSANANLQGNYNDPKSIRGKIITKIKDGTLGNLTSFHYYLGAENLLGEAIGQVIPAMKKYDTANFKTLDAVININNGIANIAPLTTVGSKMSLYAKGHFDPLNNYINLNILGRIPNEIADQLGFLREVSPLRAVDAISKLSPDIAKFSKTLLGESLTDSLKKTVSDPNAHKVPQLDPPQSLTSTFKLKLKGDLAKPKALVKGFYFID